MSSSSPASMINPGWLAVRLQALRTFSFPASGLPVLVAMAAAAPLNEWRWDVALVAVAAVLLLHGTGNLLNDFFDFRYGVDQRVEGDELRPGRVLVRRLMNPSQVLREAAVCTLLAGLCVVYLLSVCGFGLLIFAAIAAFGIYIYTGPPLKLKYHALGELTIFLIYGPALMLGSAYAQTGRFELNVLLLSLPIGFATTAILAGNNIRDDDEDAAAGIKTFSLVAGHDAAAAFYVALPTASVIMLAIMAAFGLAPIMLLACPLMLFMLAQPMRNVVRHQRTPDIDAQTARFETILLVYVLAAYAWHGPVV